MGIDVSTPRCSAIASLSAFIFSPTGNIEETMEEPLEVALELYKDSPGNEAEKGFKKVWNQVQKEVGHGFLNIAFAWKFHSDLFVELQLKCCGVEDARDWAGCPDCGFSTADAFKVWIFSQKVSRS